MAVIVLVGGLVAACSSSAPSGGQVETGPKEDNGAFHGDMNQMGGDAGLDIQRDMNPRRKVDAPLCASKLIFASAFGGTSHVDRSTITKPVMRGIDSDTGYDWGTDLPGNQSLHWFNYVLSQDSYSHWQDFVESEVVPITNGPAGAKNALYLEFKQDDPTQSAWTRSQYILTAADSGDDVQRYKHMYWAMDMKMELNHDADLGWDDFLEWKVAGETSRVSLYVYGLPPAKTPYWNIKAEMAPIGTGPKIWEHANTTIPVPDNQWFRIEAYWKASMGPDGFWKIAVDGKVLFDIKGKNRIDDNSFYTQPFKVYGVKGKSWYTNFEIRDSPPCTSVLAPL